MGTRTKNLGLYKPAANDYYNVEKDQNENFDKIDEKFGEVDKTKLDKGSYEGDAQSLKDEIDGKLNKGGYTGNAKNLNDEISKKASKSQLGRMKVGSYLSADDNGRVSVNVQNDPSAGGSNNVASAEALKRVCTPSTSNTMSASGIGLTDTRNTNPSPNEYATGLRMELKLLNSIGLNRQLYGSMLSIVPWGSRSGGERHQIVFFKAAKGEIGVARRASISDTQWSDWVTMWDSNNFNPETKFDKTGGVITGNLAINKNNQPSLEFHVGGNKKYIIYGETDALNIKNNTSNLWYKFKDDGTLILPAKNLNTSSKEIVPGINELHSRFVNPTLLYTNNNSRQDNFAVPNFSKYRVLLIKYQIGHSVNSTQIGEDIMNTIIYMEDENPNFHLLCDGRARFNVTGDNLKMTFNSIGDNFCIRKIYGLIKK